MTAPAGPTPREATPPPVPLLEARSIGYGYGRAGGATVLDDVTLAVVPGRSVGLVGESGSGKTTLLRLFLGLARPTSGEVRFEGSPLRPADRAATREFRRQVQVVFQDPYSSLDPRQRVGRIVAEPLRSLGLVVAPAGRAGAARRARAGEVRRRTVAALSAVGLADDVLERYPHEFSGGQRQRIAVARAIVGEPRILLADEPVSALDVSTRVRIVELLARLGRERDLTLVMVSHDLSVVAALCRHTAVLRRGRIVEQGPTADVLATPADRYTRDLIRSVPRLPRPT